MGIFDSLSNIFSCYFQVNAMLNFLEACHYKVSCAVCQVEGRMEPHSKFKQYIERSKDKSVRFTLHREKQECIPVGCVPPAAVTVCRGGCLPGGGSAQGGVCPEGGCLPGGCLPMGGGVHLPPVDRQTPVKT